MRLFFFLYHIIYITMGWNAGWCDQNCKIDCKIDCNHHGHKGVVDRQVKQWCADWLARSLLRCLGIRLRGKLSSRSLKKSVGTVPPSGGWHTGQIWRRMTVRRETFCMSPPDAVPRLLSSTFDTFSLAPQPQQHENNTTTAIHPTYFIRTWVLECPATYLYPRMMTSKV